MTAMNATTFTTVRTTRTPMEAELVIASLRRAGLHPVELNTAAHFSLAGADIEYLVQVPTSEMAEATDVLNSYDTPKESNEGGA